MATYFLDTSAVVKRYVPAEQGHAWIVALCDPAQGHILYISQAAFVCADDGLINIAIEEGLIVENPNGYP